MVRKPAYYQTPLRKRREIADEIFRRTAQRSYDGYSHPFCFNVKAYRVEFEFDHLLEVFRAMEGDPLYTHAEEWLRPVRERFDEHDANFWDWGIEEARSHFVGRGSSGKPESDLYTHLWDGTVVDVEYSFEGRSGGWLSINRFQGYNFASSERTCAQWRLVLDKDMKYKTLRQLYQLVVMLSHDLEKPEAAIEEGAAWAIFANVCADIPQPDCIQKKLPFMEAALA